MKPSKIFYPLMAAAAAGFFIGACSRQVNHAGGTDTNGVALAASGGDTRNADDLRRLSATYADIAKQVTPSVVNVNTQQIIRGRVFRDPFSDMFGDSGGGLYREPDQKAQSLGSGVIVNNSGIIITNNHVIQNATSITVTLTDKRRFPAKLLGTDPATDIAVLKINTDKPLPTLQWADSEKVQVGDIVLAVGSPFNLSSTVTQGIISAKGRRDLGITPIEDFLQTDAAINPGNSGGALVDIDGRLVGINSAILSKSGGNQGIGLAIPSRLVRKISGQIIATGHVTRGWLGVVAEPITDDIAAELKLANPQGVLVTGVLSNGPVANDPWSREGGNVLQKINNTEIDSPGQLRSIVSDLAPGVVVNLTVWIDGKTQVFKATIGTRGDNTQGV